MVKILNSLIVIWLIKSLAVSLFIAEPICRLGKEWTSVINWNENPLLNIVNLDLLSKIDPCLIALPDWLRMITCAQAYIYALLFIVLSLSIALEFPIAQHLIGSFLGPAYLSSTLFIASLEYVGDVPSKAFGTWLLYHIDDVIFPIVIWLTFKGGLDVVRIKLRKPKST